MNIYDVIDTVHDMMAKVVNDSETLLLDTKTVAPDWWQSHSFYLTRDAVIFPTVDPLVFKHFADVVKFGEPRWSKGRTDRDVRHNEFTTLALSDYLVALREDGNWVDTLVQKYFA